MANIDTHEHGLRGDFFAEVHSPEVTTKLGIDLSHNVEVDTVVITVDGLACHELRDDGVVGVDLVLDSSVEVLLS